MNEPKKNSAAVALGKMRTAKLSPRRRKQIAKKAATTRWALRTSTEE
jgi:hypothetical protein